MDSAAAVSNSVTTRIVEPDAHLARLAEEIVAGSERALSRGLSVVEREPARAERLLERIFPHTGHAHVVGITGSPGSGKSTLTRCLVREARRRGLTAGIIAVDPSSPFSGGSILGDRIRMNDVAVELGVFIRSLATHGALGGLCAAAADSVDLMDAAGRDMIFVETVGVGQDEVDIVQMAHTVAVLNVPGLGDDIQALKAGLLEIADVFVVNKADREGAERVQAELRAMLALGWAKQPSWVPPVLSCVAIHEEGIEPICDALVEHLEVLKTSGELARQRQCVAKARVLGIAREMVREAGMRGQGDADDLVERVLRRELTPRACARKLLAELAKEQGTAKAV
jgi:LAO/AO transport system kinase